jgi:hypothetical protein
MADEPLEQKTVEGELLTCLHVDNLTPEAVLHLRGFCGVADVRPEDYQHNKATQVFHTAVYLNTSMTSRTALTHALDEVSALGKTLEYSALVSRKMSPEDIACYELKLMLALYQASAKVRLHLRMQDGKAVHSSKLDEAYDALKQVDVVFKQFKRERDKTPLDELSCADPADTPLRYIGMRHIAPVLLKIAQDTSHPLPENDTFFNRMRARIKAMQAMTLQDWADLVRGPASLNDGRLYLVWTDEWINQDLNVLKLRMPNIMFGVADGILAKLALLTGSMGWILYFTQVSLEGGIYVQNTCDMRDTWLKDMWPSGLQVTDEVHELQLTHDELARAQPFERKVLLWNNGVWGAVNYLCFFFLTGFWGDALNGALFLFDYALTYKQYEQAQKDHVQVIQDYDHAISALNARLEVLEQEQGNASPAFLRLQKERDALIAAKKKTIRDWQYNVTQGRLDLFYSGSVVIAFAILCAFFWPSAFTALAVLAFALLGSFMCFSLGIAYDAIGLHIEMSKEAETLQDVDARFGVELDVFEQRLSTLEPGDAQAKHELEFLYLMLRDTVASSDYQHELMRYHQANMWVKILTESLFPVLFITTFAFLPLTMAAAGFALGLFIMVVAKSYVDEMAPEPIREESRSVGWFSSAKNATYTFFRGAELEEEPEPEPPLLNFDKFCDALTHQTHDKHALRALLLPQTGPSDDATPSELSSLSAY